MSRNLRFLGIVFLMFVFPLVSFAQVEHQLIHRVAVFPVKVERQLKKSAENTWWSMREALTESDRFLVASKSFLQQKDLYQARGELQPADALILAKLLDAHALVTTEVHANTMKMNVYEGEFGRVLWQHEISLQKSLPVSEQIEATGKKLMQDFVASLPYQGYVVVDPLKGRPVYEENAKKVVKIKVGQVSQIEVGDPVQLIRLHSESLKPQLPDGMTMEVFAEGTVITKESGQVVVTITRAEDFKKIKAYSLVRFPNEDRKSVV